MFTDLTYLTEILCGMSVCISTLILLTLISAWVSTTPPKTTHTPPKTRAEPKAVIKHDVEIATKEKNAYPIYGYDTFQGTAQLYGNIKELEYRGGSLSPDGIIIQAAQEGLSVDDIVDFCYCKYCGGRNDFKALKCIHCSAPFEDNNE